MYNVLGALTSIVEAVMYFFVFEALLERRYHRVFFPYIMPHLVILPYFFSAFHGLKRLDKSVNQTAIRNIP